MARRLTDTYFVKCNFSIRFETDQQRLSPRTCVGVYVIPEEESVVEYIKTVTEKNVKSNYGNDSKIAGFAIIEITPL